MSTPGKKRLLFVEDNPLLLHMYPLLLENEGARWEVDTAVGGAEALDILARSPVDVIVTDLRMPGMSGVELLAEVRGRFPSVSRIIVSAIDDQQEIAQCLNATHQFLAKPVDPRVLKATLARIGNLDRFLGDESLKALLGQIQTLPSFPSLYVEIMTELNTKEPSLERIAGIVAKDPGMTAKMLQIANSAALGLGHEVTGPFESVQLLGMATVRSLALTVHIFSRFQHTKLKGFSAASLWDHVTHTALLARMILRMEHAESGDVEDAFIAGMLHDIGKLILAENLPREFEQAVALARNRQLLPHEAEVEVFGASHAAVAAYLLGLWGLPAAIVEAVAFHHSPMKVGLPSLDPLAAVHVADALAHEVEGATQPGAPILVDEAYLSALGCDRRIDAWRAAVEDTLGSEAGVRD